MKELGNKIKYLRKNSNLSLQKLADLLECSKAHIFEIEKGCSQISFINMQKMAIIFNKPLQFFSINQGVKMLNNTIMQYFGYGHLPEHLQEISQKFAQLAVWMDDNLPDGAEKSAGLRKLLEAKDCAVRAKI